MAFGWGKYTYELVDGWAKLPADWSFRDVGGLTVDAEDRVYVFNRSPHPMIVLNRQGKFLSSWGEGVFVRPHGARFDASGNIWCVDDGGHSISKCSPQGKVLKVLGTKGKPSDTGYVQQEELEKSLATIKRGGLPFNRPTGVAFASNGELYASDGYGNARVHKFSPDGAYLTSWGGPGGAPGRFRLPHNIWIDKYDRIWIPDRENSRIQIFDAGGDFITQWSDVFRPTDIFIDNAGVVYVSELRPGVSVFSIDGKLLARWSNEEKDPATDLFIAPHAITVDSYGDIYVGEVAITHAGYDKGSKTVQKFAMKR